jgi:hypothetical protein
VIYNSHEGILVVTHTHTHTHTNTHKFKKKMATAPGGPGKASTGDAELDSIRDYLIGSNIIYDAEEWVSLSKQRDAIAKMDEELTKRLKLNKAKLRGEGEVKEIDKILEPRRDLNEESDEDIRKYVALGDALDHQVAKVESSSTVNSNQAVQGKLSNMNPEIKFTNQQLTEASQLARQHALNLAANQANRLIALREAQEFEQHHRVPNLNEILPGGPQAATAENYHEYDRNINHLDQLIPDSVQKLLDTVDSNRLQGSTADAASPAHVDSNRRRIEALKSSLNAVEEEQQRVTKLSYDDVVQWRAANNRANDAATINNAAGNTNIGTQRSKDKLNELDRIEMNSRNIDSFLNDWLTVDREAIKSNPATQIVAAPQTVEEVAQVPETTTQSPQQQQPSGPVLDVLERLTHELESMKRQQANIQQRQQQQQQRQQQQQQSPQHMVPNEIPFFPHHQQQPFQPPFQQYPPYGPPPLQHPFYNPYAPPNMMAYPNPYQQPHFPSYQQFPPQYPPQQFAHPQQQPQYGDNYNNNSANSYKSPPPRRGNMNTNDSNVRNSPDDLDVNNSSGANNAPMSRQEQRHQQELRRIQQELEKLKAVKQLEDFKQETNKSRTDKSRDDAHAMWLAEQAQKLQAIKMEIALAKERQTLNLHNEAASSSSASNNNSGTANMGVSAGSNTSSSGAGNTNAADGGTSSQPIYSSAEKLLRTEAGVGVEYVSLSTASACAGAIAIVDGVIVPVSQRQGSQFRVLLGIHDSSGKNVARMQSSDWMDWPKGTSNLGSASNVAFLPVTLKRSAKPADLLLVPPGADGVSAEPLPQQQASPYPRAIIEVQYRQQEPASASGVRLGTASSVGVLGTDSSPKLLGWGTLALRSPTVVPASMRTQVDPIEGSKLLTSPSYAYLLNGLWRISMNKGLSDLQFDPLEPHPVDECLLSCCILCRVADMSQKISASAWLPATPAPVNDVFATYMDPIDTVVKKLIADIGGSKGTSDGNGNENNKPSSAAVGNRDSKTGATPSGSRLGTANNNNSSSALNNFSLIRPPTSSSVNGGAAGGGAVTARAIPPTPSSARPPSSSAQADGGINRSLQDPIPEEANEQSPRSPASPRSPRGGKAVSSKAPPLVTNVNNEKALATGYWLMGTPIGPATDRYQRNDGIDLYLDACRYLPDNTTFIRVEVKLFTLEKEMIGAPVRAEFQPGSTSAINPVIGKKIEFRDPSYNATATALIRIDTLDSATMQPCFIGYSVIKLFAQRDRKQPKFAQESNIYINSGAFQLPIKAGTITAEAFDEEKFLATNPRIPCASLLVRIVPARKSGDGLTCLNLKDYPEEDHERLGIRIPAPAYSSGAYAGGLCEPDESCLENLSYLAKISNSRFGSDESYDSILTQCANHVQRAPSAKWYETFMLPDRPNELHPMNWTYCVPYSLDTGLSVSVDCIYNLPDASTSSSLFALPSGVIYKAIYSILPPGLFYKEPPLSEQVKFTVNSNLDSNNRAPTFSDGYNQFFPPRLSEQTYLLIDIRSVKISTPAAGTSADPFTVEVQPPGAKNSYWTILPLSKELFAGRGFDYVNTGVFCLPLIQGSLESCKDVITDNQPLQRLLAKLKMPNNNPNNCRLNESGASVIVRVVNPLTRHLWCNELKDDILFQADRRTTSALHTDVINTAMVDTLLTAAKAGNPRGAATFYQESKFAYSDTRMSAGKSILLTVPAAAAADPKRLRQTLNREFSNRTGIALL